MRNLRIAILHDAAEDEEKARAEAEGRTLTLACETVQGALAGLGHEAEIVAAPHDVRDLVATVDRLDPDMIVNLCEALGGVSDLEQDVAMLLELLGKPFTGSGSMGLALAQDKELSKKILHFHSVPCPKYAVMDSGAVEWADDLQFPVLIKPLNQDASIGIDATAVASSLKELMERISSIHTGLGVPALIEEYIEGREIYVSVLGNARPEALPIVEMEFRGLPPGARRIASSEAKWDEESALFKATVETFPEDIPAEVCARMQAAAVTACKALKIRDYGRVDMRLRRNGEEWEFFVIEVNPNPDLDRDGELAMAARRAGLDYERLIERILALALERTGLHVGFCPREQAENPA